MTTKLEIRDIAIRAPLMMHRGRLAPLGAPFDPRFAPLQSDDHELSWRALTALGLKSAYVGVSIHSDKKWSHQRDGEARPLATVHAKERNWASLLAMYADELAQPRAARYETRRLSALPDGIAPRIVATVGRPSEFQQLRTLVRRVQRYEPTLPIHVADSGLSEAERTEAEGWSRVVLGPRSVGVAAADVVASLLLSRGGLILWLDPAVQVHASLFAVFRSITARGFVFGSAGARACGDRIVGVNAAHAPSVVDGVLAWLACASDRACSIEAMIKAKCVRD